jgi:hypothetical protein
MTLALLQAVADDDLQTIRQLLLRGVDVNSCGLLHQLVLHRRYDAISLQQIMKARQR